MTSEAIVSYSGWAGTALAAGWACYQQFRIGKNNESQRVNEAKDELIKSVTANKDEWKARFEATSHEYGDYRTSTLRTSQEAQAKLLAMTEEVARLRSATDISPLLADRKAQAEINTKIVGSLDIIMEHLQSLRPCKLTPKKAAASRKGKTE